MFVFWMVGCDSDPKPPDTADTADTADPTDTGDTGDTGDTAPEEEMAAVDFAFSTVYVQAFDGACMAVDKAGAFEPNSSYDVDNNGIIDCGLEGGDIELTTTFASEDPTVEADVHWLNPAEFSAAASSLWAKVERAAPEHYDQMNEVCDEVCSALLQGARKGTCPEFTGTAVSASANRLTTAMNSLESAIAQTLSDASALNGAWCFISVRPEHRVAGSAAQAPANIWWAVIYGLRNYAAAAVVYKDATTKANSSTAVYSLSYRVAGKAAQTYLDFLNGDLLGKNGTVPAYPQGSTFQATPLTASWSTNGTTKSTSTSWPTWWSSPGGTAIIDPEFEGDVLTGLEELDAFLVAQTEDVAGTPRATILDPSKGTCPESSGFEEGGAPVTEDPGTPNLGTLTPSGDCVE